MSELPAPVTLRRDQVLAFVIEQIARHGLSPTMGEIARELNISDSRAKQLMGQLVEKGVIDRVPGSIRGLRVRDMAESRRQLAEVLRRLGWAASDPVGELRGAPGHPMMVAILADISSADLQAVTAPPVPPSEHLPDLARLRSTASPAIGAGSIVAGARAMAVLRYACGAKRPGRLSRRPGRGSI